MTVPGWVGPDMERPVAAGNNEFARRAFHFADGVLADRQLALDWKPEQIQPAGIISDVLPVPPHSQAAANEFGKRRRAQSQEFERKILLFAVGERIGVATIIVVLNDGAEFDEGSSPLNIARHPESLHDRRLPQTLAKPGVR